MKYMATQQAKKGTRVFTNWYVARQRLGTVNLDTIFFHSPFLRGLVSSAAGAVAGAEATGELDGGTEIGGASVSGVMIGRTNEAMQWQFDEVAYAE